MLVWGGMTSEIVAESLFFFDVDIRHDCCANKRCLAGFEAKNRQPCRATTLSKDAIFDGGKYISRYKVSSRKCIKQDI